ncbi:unnamed protein product, partial [Mesorhabditis spiculigera]
MTIKQLLLLLAFLATGLCFWSHSDSARQTLAHSKRLIVNELHRCVPQRRYTETDLDRILGKNLQRHWDALQMDLLVEANELNYQKIEQCLAHIQRHIVKVHKQLKRMRKNEIRRLRDQLEDSSSEVHQKLHRKSRSAQKHAHPRELPSAALEWMGEKEKAMLERFRQTNPDKWDVLVKTGQIFYRSRKDVRAKSQEALDSYCKKNLVGLLGDEKFEELKEMKEDSATVESIEAKFSEIVSELSDEEDRLNAEHYGQFCRKIFRITKFKPDSLTAWLSNSQKRAIMTMIQDPNIGDAQVYDKMFEYYSSTSGAEKDTAHEAIDNGCRRFIAHTFGEDIEEEIDVAISHNSSTRQQLASQLAVQAEQIQNDHNRKLVTDSLPICTRIYIGYDYSCDCNGHSDECHPSTYACLACGGNSYGTQCEKCLEDFDKDENGNCVASGQMENKDEKSEVPQCECNGHSETCTLTGKCTNCTDNTGGDKCELCLPGFYGDSREGTTTDCTPCPCPNGGECVVNESGLVECLNCPTGTNGMMCEKKDSSSSEEAESSASRRRRFRRYL